MSLCVSAGILVDLAEYPEASAYHRECFTRVNELLAEKGLPPHFEPEQLPPLKNRSFLQSYPYSYLHHLRRAYAHRALDPSWTPSPLPENERASLDPVLEDESLYDSHLIWHSDCVGYYLPIDFKSVIGDEAQRAPGGMLGSSYRLRDELLLVAPALGIKLNVADLPDSEAELINRDGDKQEGIWIERVVWLSLFEAARLSIQHKTAICFS